MATLREIADVIEKFAPLELQENYDNSGIQVGMPDAEIKSVMLCLDVTEDILEEAIQKGCNLIVTHHPLLFKKIKNITGKTQSERILIKAIKENISIYSSHTNLDSAEHGISHEIASLLDIKDVEVLEPISNSSGKEGLGVIGNIKATPKMEFLRKVKDTFGLKCLRFSSQTPQLVIRKVAACGGAGAFLINKAMEKGADVIVTGDIKYHDFNDFGSEILIADIGHFESELCSRKILNRILKENFPHLDLFFSQKETNPINYM